MASVVGEKLTRAIELAIQKRLPLLIVSASGGARMQEGILSLMQMAKTAAALKRLADERLPYISLLTDPTTGGVTASFAMLGDLILAEPRALIGFAGPRVIAETIRQPLPEGFQRSEFLLEHGQLDLVVERREMRETLRRIVGFFAGPLAARAMTYREAVARITGLRGGEMAGMRPGLERIEALLEAIGNPERAMTLVQVAGTNGKGSVVRHARGDPAGRRPPRRPLHLAPPSTCASGSAWTAARSRRPISPTAWKRSARLVARLDATMFEALTALALDHFASEGVEVAVLEAGLGRPARLDLCRPSRRRGDHAHRLRPPGVSGRSRSRPSPVRKRPSSGAGSRSRPGRSLPSWPCSPDTRLERGVPLLVEGRDLAVRVRRATLEGQWLDLEGSGWRLDDVRCALLGRLPARQRRAGGAPRRAPSAPGRRDPRTGSPPCDGPADSRSSVRASRSSWTGRTIPPVRARSRPRSPPISLAVAARSSSASRRTRTGAGSWRPSCPWRRE